ncbi:hypothetical protein [Peptoniphilus sp. HMSC062D09]
MNFPRLKSLQKEPYFLQLLE